MHELFTEQHKIRRTLTFGDLLCYFAATLVAYMIMPGEVGLSLRQVLESFLPFALTWMVLAPFAGLFRATVALEPRQLWLVGLLAVVGTPLGAWVGSLWSGEAVGQASIVVITLLAAAFLVGWRYLFIQLGLRSAG